MNNHLLSLIIGFLICAHIKPVYAQMQYTVWSTNYIYLNSYLGYQSPDRFNTVQFSLDDINYIKNNWSLSVRLLEPIKIINGTNRSGKPFPTDKISLAWTGDNGDPNFRLSKIGASFENIVIPSSGEVFLINKSKQPLSTWSKYYTVYQLYGKLSIKGGRYLEDYLNTDKYAHAHYNFRLLYTLYDSQLQTIASQIVPYDLHIPPQLSDGHLVDVKPDYSILINPEMQEVNLSFKNLIDYQQGVSKQIQSALVINANTDYEIRVKALENEIRSPHGESIPLDLLKLQFLPAQNTSGTVMPFSLSTAEQAAFKGSSKDKNIERHIDLKYEISLPSSAIKKIKIDTYSVSLLYQLLPL